jgi:hypothetical protein
MAAALTLWREDPAHDRVKYSESVTLGCFRYTRLDRRSSLRIERQALPVLHEVGARPAFFIGHLLRFLAVRL